ncbi:Carbohydrate-selective porin, OprB family [Pseudoruegeria aquimaris]|uniref:Carbohydrate-selective porin, OprB family n=1 Tax=Pseudoruegeria aquimaris TaxID=393663 RepID=A0A1Y5SYB3_9RHOB|nr:carbohydrate porin [Pseudoruegeria aquimaris]SLN51543.1 Carbohydrate-selective porin, OprB family [Pseudoruegeria aquimaris]
MGVSGKASFVAAGLLALVFQPAGAEGLSGPSSVGADLSPGDGLTDPQFRSDFPRSALPGFYAWKDGLAEGGFSFGADYLALGQWGNSDIGPGEASGGIARLFGTFDAGNGHAFTFKIENRHAFGAVAPQFFGLESGALAITGTAFNDTGTLLTNLFYTYRDPEGRFTFQAGQIDVTDFLDVYSLVSPYTSFQNLAFNTNPTINAPNPGLGMAAGLRLGDTLYAVASIADANGDPSSPDADVFSSGETFKSLEIGYTSGFDRLYFDNIHLTLWQSDGSAARGRAEDKGASFSASWLIGNEWAPFLRFGVSDGTAALYSRSLSTGLGWYRRNTDLAGIGLNWAEVNGIDGRQFTAEAFYRFSISPNLQITPSIQFIDNPLLDPTQGSISLVGLRARILF